MIINTEIFKKIRLIEYTIRAQIQIEKTEKSKITRRKFRLKIIINPLIYLAPATVIHDFFDCIFVIAV